MHHRLLILVSAVVLALPSIVFVSTAVADAPASPPQASPSIAPAALPSVTPSASPSPGDTTPPVTTARGAGSGWRNTTATVELSATDASGVAATFYRVDDGAWQLGEKVLVKAPKDHSNDGEHAIEFYSVDNALNSETPRSVIVRIDTRPPRFTWVGVSPGVVRSVAPVTCKFAVVERTGPVTLAYRVTDQYGYFAASKGGLRRGGGTSTLAIPTRYGRSRTGFTPGVYRIEVSVRDEAGNVTTSGRRSFRDFRPASGGVWHSVPGAGRRVALTFDDGGAGPWASILGTLRRYGMHATFFPLGPYVQASPGLARRCVADGNAIGTHGWTHARMTTQSPSEIRSEWTRAAVVWWAETGYSPAPYCRPPYGDLNGATVAASAAVGFSRVILWDVDPQDWSEPGASVIAARVLSHVHPGAIVCLHLRPQTAAALPAILRGLKARGYRSASLPEMFHAAGLR